LEWNRILKPGGIILMIFPKRDALPADSGRPVSSLREFIEAHENDYTVDTMPEDWTRRAHGRRGHYWVWNLQLMIDLIEMCNHHYDLGWKLMLHEETDSKVGNGHTVMYRYLPKPEAMWPVFMSAVMDTALHEDSPEEEEGGLADAPDIEYHDAVKIQGRPVTPIELFTGENAPRIGDVNPDVFDTPKPPNRKTRRKPKQS
jgi:hypothetical protein